MSDPAPDRPPADRRDMLVVAAACFYPTVVGILLSVLVRCVLEWQHL